MSDGVSQSSGARGLGVSPRLVAINLILLVGLGVVTFVGTAARGQGGGAVPAGERGRGEYTMVSGRVQGATTATLYILDGANQEIVAMTWDRNNSKLEVLGHRSLNDDARYLQRPR